MRGGLANPAVSEHRRISVHLLCKTVTLLAHHWLSTRENGKGGIRTPSLSAHTLADCLIVSWHSLRDRVRRRDGRAAD
jgi:hypothetical protein